MLRPLRQPPEAHALFFSRPQSAQRDFCNPALAGTLAIYDERYSGKRDGSRAANDPRTEKEIRDCVWLRFPE